MKKLFFAAIAVLLSFAVQAQEFDSVRIDTTIHPSPTHIKIRFPHSGFQLIDCIYYYPLSYPPQVEAKIVFKECTGTPTLTYFDTTLNLYIDNQTRVFFMLFLAANTTDSNCVLHTGNVMVDSFYKDFGISQSIQNIQDVAYVIYPNPVKNSRISIDVKNSKIVIARVYSAHGDLLVSYAFNSAKADIELPLNISPGNYLLELRMENGDRIRKLITIQH